MVLPLKSLLDQAAFLGLLTLAAESTKDSPLMYGSRDLDVLRTSVSVLMVQYGSLVAMLKLADGESTGTEELPMIGRISQALHGESLP